MGNKTWKDKGVSGLANVGNTCYVNTAIQCLSYCRHFLRYVLQHPVLSSSDPPPAAAAAAAANSTSVVLMDELRDLLQALWVEQYSLVPRRFIRALQTAFAKSLVIREQNDLGEFLLLFLNRLCEDVGTHVPSQDLQQARDAVTQARSGEAQLIASMDHNWLQTHARTHSPLAEMLYGQQVVQVQCTQCKYITHNHESFLTLSMSLPSPSSSAAAADSSTVSLQEIVKTHMASEALEDAWCCDACKTTRRAGALQTHKFWRFPKLLIVTIKRFTPTLKKITTRVEAPMRLDLNPYSIYDPHGRFKLRAIACHSGSFGSGHYYALCHHPNGRWYCFDDLSISEVSDPPLAASSDSYVFFYEQSRSLPKKNSLPLISTY
jgi:ubiquitin carboxyl-terminal hydrolase 8